MKVIPRFGHTRSATLSSDIGKIVTQDALPYAELFGHCTRGHRARLVYYDKAGRNQEPYVYMFVMGVPGTGGVNVYRVACPKCGEEYTTTDRGAELVERKDS